MFLSSLRRSVEILFCTMDCFFAQFKKGCHLANYKMLLNNFFDIELEGYGLECGHRVGTYIEKGKNQKTVPNPGAGIEMNKASKERKIKR